MKVELKKIWPMTLTVALIDESRDLDAMVRQDATDKIFAYIESMRYLLQLLEAKYK